MDKLKLGIIGYGNIGTAHSKNIMGGKTPHIDLVAVCDIDPDRLEVAKKNCPDVVLFDDAQKLMSSGLCDAVLIAVPHYDHCELVKKGFSYGLHVICEKPAGVYTLQALEMNEASENTDKLFAIMYNQRTNPVYIKIREMVKSGELGHIKRITWIITDWYRSQAYHDSSTWRSMWKTEGGGALINQNPHQLDLWQWMFGMPERIYARVSFGKYYNIEVEDDVMAYFEYDNGTTGEYITSTGEAPGTNRLEIACDMGKLVIEDNKLTFTKNEISEREFNKTNELPFGMPKNEIFPMELDFSGGPQHSGILENFANAVLKGESLIADGREGILGLTISNAIHLSGWTGDTVDVRNFPHEKFYEMLQYKIKNSTMVKKENKVVADTEGTY